MIEETKQQRPKAVIVAGPPATGKTEVMLHVVKNLQRKDQKVAVVKVDCLETEDDVKYAALGVPVAVGLSNDICPDHFYAVNYEEMISWTEENEAEILVIETAGLCHRCAPGIEGVLTFCVVDCLSSIKTPQKAGPVVTTSDVVIMTKGDMVSQAEREVFRAKIREINDKALIVEANGLTGSGCEGLATIIHQEDPLQEISDSRLRHPMPTAICSYCMGEKRLGNKHQHGVVYKMDFSKRGGGIYA
ncbi:GTP-binding protein [Tindallia californiensis]|uniref:Ni2+-binding GTPase involved in regulation of expression and maturation of urease and hydrogenase n=1 Tax=Tindallia californiensis TaxID=159292 RepID=A0A1H3R4V3_9FIRM|nr:GTP-binding protein [Tindallia californiensis]SDZ20824.1 Ni2+-binding GTPase involved in regulation of expression and maturation of urease and hydrogenase [Tindallia californiensis]